METPTTTAKKLLTPEEAAQFLGLSVTTLADWRYRGRGPEYLRLSQTARGRIRYPAESLAAWVEALRRRHSTAEYSTPEKK